MIERGEYDADTFIRELKQLLAAIIDDVKNDQGGVRIVSPTKTKKPSKSRKSSWQRKKK